MRTVDAYWNDKLAADGEAARVLAGMAAANSDFNVTEGGRAVAFLQQDDFYRNRVLYAAYIRENASLYDKALADWTPGSRQALQGKIQPSSLALIESVASGAMGNETGDYVKRDADGKPLQGTIFDTLADVKAAQRELIAAERQLKEELAKPGLSDSARQETENQLKQVRYEMGTANTASDLVLINYGRMVLDGKLAGYGAVAKDTAIGLLELADDLNKAKYSRQAQKNLENRAVALMEALVGSKEIINNLQRTYEYADYLEQNGEIQAAAAVRAETSLLLASTLSGVGGIAKGAAGGIEKLAATTGKLASKAEALVAKGAGKAADLFDPKSGQVSSGHGAASAAADAEAGMPVTRTAAESYAEVRKLFDQSNPYNTLNVAGHDLPVSTQVAGWNRTGTTVVLESQALTDAQIARYAEHLAGGQQLQTVAPGVMSTKLADGSTVTLRSLSTSQAQTGARWTIEVRNNSQLGSLSQIKDKFEIKFR